MGYLRIIGGEHRGRRIAVPAGVGVRPTADRVREALFSILGSRVPGARVLDAYAGSGALGFEALSRGALAATLVEADRRGLQTLRASATDLALEARVRLVHGRVLDLLRRGALVGPFELIFADPPYEAGEGEAFLALALGRLAPGGRIVLEREKARETSCSAGLEHTRTACYGRCCLDFYAHGKASEGAC